MTINTSPESKKPNKAFKPIEPYEPIGFIGIGNMGFAMMARLASQKWPVFVHDIDSVRVQLALTQGAKVCATPAEIAQNCRISFIVVVDAQQVATC